MTKRAELLGLTFGYLTVIGEASYKIYDSGKQAIQWPCRCVCGKEVFRTSSYLLRENVSLSCGCKSFTKRNGNTEYDDPKIISYRAKVKAYKMEAAHKTKTIVWNLSEEQAIALFIDNCYYCGSPPSNTYNVYMTKAGRAISRNIERCKSAEIKFNGIDRKDSSLGYTIDNVVSCCKACNFAKNEMSVSEFYDWLDRLARHNGYKK